MTTLFLAVLAICVVLYFAAPRRGDDWHKPRVRIFVNGWEFKNGHYYYNTAIEWVQMDFTERLELGPPLIIDYRPAKCMQTN